MLNVKLATKGISCIFSGLQIKLTHQSHIDEDKRKQLPGTRQLYLHCTIISNCFGAYKEGWYSCVYGQMHQYTWFLSTYSQQAYRLAVGEPIFEALLHMCICLEALHKCFFHAHKVCGVALYCTTWSSGTNNLLKLK